MFKTIRSKLSASFGALAALLVAMSVFSYIEMASVHRQFEELVLEDAQRSKLSNHVLDAVSGRALEARNLVVAKDAAGKERARTRVAAHHTALAEGLKKLRSAAALSDYKERELPLIAKIEAVESRYGPVALWPCPSFNMRSTVIQKPPWRK